MTDKEFRTQQRRLQRLITRWVNPLGLGYWRLTFAYARDTYEAPSGTPSDRSLAHCTADWRYLHATITWNMALVAEQSDDELEGAFVHELCHCLINECREQDDWLNHEERVATSLAKAFLWIRGRAPAPAR